jgi:uncharacterized protein (TIGR03086 family)
MDGVTALERSYDKLTAWVANLKPDQLDSPTPCTEWDIRGLLNHTLGAARMFTLVNEGQAVGEHAGDVVGDDPAAALATISVANVAAWRAPGALDGERTYPFGTFPAAAGLAINVGEILLHGWDLAKATAQEARIDDDVASFVLDFYKAGPMEQYRQWGVFGPEIVVTESAGPQARLIGFLGRQP